MGTPDERPEHQATPATGPSGQMGAGAQGMPEPVACGAAALASFQVADEQAAKAYLGYAEQLAGLLEKMGKIKAGDRLNKGVRGLPAVMRALSMAGGPLSPSEIASCTGVSDARVANALRSLEERGLVERKQAEGDRRRVEVTLTPKGAAEDERLRNEGLMMLADFLCELGEGDAQDLIRIVERTQQVMLRRKEQGRQFRPSVGSFGADSEKGE